MVSVGSKNIEDPGRVAYNPFASMVYDFSTISGRVSGVSRLMHLAAERFFVGGDRFPQSYSKALDLIKSTGTTRDGISIAAVAKHLGLGTSRDPTAAFRIAVHGAFDVNAPVSAVNLAVMLLEYSKTPDGWKFRKEIEEEAIRILERTEEMNIPAAGFNLMAYNLIKGNPVKANWLVSLTGSMSQGLTSAAHTVGRLTSSTLLGLRSCSQSWSLMARLVRRNLWYQTIHETLHEKGPIADISDTDLMDLAAAGVENSELALALRDDVVDGYSEAKSRLLAFSAYRGKAAAQFALAKQIQKSKLINVIGPREKALQHCPMKIHDYFAASEPASSYEHRLYCEETDYILDAWDVNPWKEIAMDPDSLSRSAIEAIVNDPERWMEVEEDGPETAEIIAESIYVLAWRSFLGKGTGQSLRDSLIWVGRLSKSLSGYWILEKVHYVTLQMLFTANLILNTWSLEVAVALISLCFVSGVLVKESNV